MARQNNPNKSGNSQESEILKFFYLISTILIAIGDGVRYPFRYSWYLLTSLYNILKVFFIESSYAIASWATEKKESFNMKPKRKPGRPKITLTPHLPKIHWPTIRVPRFNIGVPRFSFPKVKVPHVTFPRIQFPRFTFPKHQKRLIRLPPPPAVIKIPVSKTEQTKSFIAGICVTVLFIFLPYNGYQWLKALPNPQLLTRRDLEVTTKIFDRHGTLLYEIYADQNRTPLALTQIPKILQEATIAIEDKDFYHHPGFSVTGIARAARETLLNNQVQGGSTITQQLIKSALLSPEQRIGRKLKEIVLAFWAERIYGKNQILEMYLNQVPYGGTAWGVEAAAQTYFGKSVRDLNLAEAALLAGLPAAPSEYSPFGAHPEKAFERQKEVLQRMREDRYITQDQEKDALATPIQFAQQTTAIRAPHFVMYVKDLLEKQYGPRLVERGGLRITTSLDLPIQEKTEAIVRTQIDSLSSLQVGNGAALVTNPKTGEILAMVGSRDYFDTARDGNVNVTTALRQPGSSIKVVNYAAALESATPAGGQGFTAATILDDSPIVYQYPGSPSYAPVNYDGKFHGLVPLRYALANSYNIPAVKTLAKIGVPAMVAKGQAMGIESWTDPSRFGLSLTLGGGEVTVLDMARVFGTLANNGKKVNLMPILEVTDYAGNVLEKHAPNPGVQAVKPAVAWILSNILSDNTARISAFGPNSSLVVAGKTVSVKTGTTNDKRDNWTIGYTPSFLTAVWVGNNNNAPMNPFLTSGITGAAPIWHDIMAELLKDKQDEVPVKPEDVVSVPCYFGRPEYFVKGTEPASGSCAPIPTPSATPSP